ncbi:MAG: hypothetical protein DA405_10070 [Bacteroidetes bacterium]|nr:MAG: hypothetical protein DA405_10070 [Bacteroidota bacterium]
MHYLEQELTQKYGFNSTILSILSNQVFSGIWFWDLENPEEEYFDDQFWLTLGYDPKEMPAKSDVWQSLVHPEDLKEAFKLVQTHLANPSVPYKQVLRYQHKQGHIIYVHCTGHAVVKEGKPVRLLGVHFEITADHLRLKNLESFFTLNKDLALLLDGEGLILEANPEAHKVLSIANEEIGILKLKKALARKGFPLASIKEIYNQNVQINGPTGELELKVSIIPNGENFLFLAHDYTQELRLTNQVAAINEVNKTLVAISENYLVQDFGANSFWDTTTKGLAALLPSLQGAEIAVFSYEDIENDIVSQLCRFTTNSVGYVKLEEKVKEYPLSFFKEWRREHNAGESLIIDNLEEVKSEEIKSFLSTSNSQTYMAVPLFADKQLKGFVSYNWSHPLQLAQELLPSLKLFSKIVSKYWSQLGAHSKLKYQEHITSLVLNSIKSPIAIIDRNSRILSANERLNKLLGTDRAVQRRTQIDLIDFLNGKDGQSLISSLKEPEQNQQNNFYVSLKTISGAVEFELSFSELQEEHGNADKILVEFKDLYEINLLKQESEEVNLLSKFILNESPLYILRFSTEDHTIGLINEKTQALLDENPWLKKLEKTNHPFRKSEKAKNSELTKQGRLETAVVLDGKNISIEWDLLSEENNAEQKIRWAFGRDNTVFHKAQLEVERKTRELVKTQSLAKIGSYYYDVQNDHFEWSEENYRIFELNPEGLAIPPNHFSFVHENDQEKVDSIMDLAKSGDMEFYSAHRIVTSKGKVKYIEDRCQLEFDQLGDAITYRGVVKDITQYRERQHELLKLNKELEEANALLQLSAKISRILDGELESPKKEDKLLKALGELPHIKQISLIGLVVENASSLANSYTYNLQKVYGKGKDENYNPIPFKKSVHHLPFDLRTELYNSEKNSNCGILNAKLIKPSHSLFTEQKWTKASAVYVIAARKNDNEFLLFCLETKNDLIWTDATLDHIRKITRNIAQYFDQQNYLHKIEESEERFKIINRVSQSVIWEHDLESNTLFRGEGFERIHGNVPQKENAKLAFEDIHPEDCDRIESISIKMQKGELEIGRYDFRLKHAKGHYIDTENMAIAVKNSEGKVYKIIGSMIDRSANIEQRKLLQTAGDVGKLATIDINLEDREIRNISQNLANIFDLQIQDVSLQNSQTKFYDSKSQTWLTGLEALLKTDLSHKESGNKWEAKIRTNKGAEKWIRLSFTTIFKEEKPYRIIGIVQDITREKESTLNLEESLFWLNKTQEIGKIGHFRISLDNGSWEVSQQLKNSLEYPKDLTFDPMNWMSFIKPQYREEVQEKFSLAEKENKGFSVIYEVMVGLNPNKNKWLEIDSEVIHVNNERFLVGSAKDISETQALNARLELHREKMKEISWKQSHLARGPLTRLIIQASEVLKKDNLQDQTRSLLESIMLSAQEVDNTLKDSNALVETLNFIGDLKPEVFQGKGKDLAQFIGYKVNLIVVDDDPIICALHQQILKRAELACTIQAFSSGAKLFENLKVEENTLNLIMLDINMPEMSGLEVLRKLANTKMNKNCLVIMVSSSISTSDKVECASYPFVLDYYEKPLNPEHINKLELLPFSQKEGSALNL